MQRSQFMNPVHLPMLTESFLAKDFDFSEYLAIKLGNAINDHFKVHFVTLICVLPLLTACFFYVGSASAATNDLVISNAIMIGIFALSITLFYLVKFDLT